MLKTTLSRIIMLGILGRSDVVERELQTPEQIDMRILDLVDKIPYFSWGGA